MDSARFSFITLLMATLIGHPAATLGATNVQSLASANNAFALDLYAKLKGGEGNLFFSPYSVSGCLAMTYAGARGNTASQMAQTLHFPTDQAQLAASFGELQRQLNALEAKQNIQLSIANGLWAQQSHPFLPAFLDVAKTTYQAQVNQVDFRTQAEPVRQEINTWVEHQTNGKIPNLLAPGMVDPLTRLILVNAIYFKGQWAYPFNKTNTANQPFTVSPNQKVQAPLMHLKADFKYAEVERAQVLELAYAGGDLSMVILLPKDAGGLKTLEAALNTQTLNTWLATHEQKVDVFLPRFKLSAEFGLARTLADMGMKDAFTPTADFSGMDGAHDLFISAVVHKAYADVNEEGTEAAAATGTLMKLRAVRPQPIPVFRADHPFLFLIRDTHSGSILFLGRVLDPAKGAAS